MVNNWKVTAIIFIVYSILLTSLFIWGYIIITEEEGSINKCYYNTCNQYPEAYWDAGVCSCYDYNEDGELEVVKTLYEE